MEVPGQSRAPEDAPVILGPEYGRSAALDRRIRHIAVVVAVTGGGEGAEVAVQAVAAGRNHVGGVLALEGDALHIAVGEAFRVVDDFLVVGLGDAPVEGCEEVVDACDFVVELRRHVPGIGGIAAVRLFVAAASEDLVGVVKVRVLPRLELVRPGLLGIDAETGHHTQELEELVFGVEVVGYGQILAGVGGTDRGVVHRIGHQAEERRDAVVRIVFRLEYFLEFALLVIRSQVGIEGRIFAETAPRGLRAVHMRDAHKEWLSLMH